MSVIEGVIKHTETINFIILGLIVLEIYFLIFFTAHEKKIDEALLLFPLFYCPKSLREYSSS